MEHISYKEKDLIWVSSINNREKNILSKVIYEKSKNEYRKNRSNMKIHKIDSIYQTNR